MTITNGRRRWIHDGYTLIGLEFWLPASNERSTESRDSFKTDSEDVCREANVELQYEILAKIGLGGHQWHLGYERVTE